MADTKQSEANKGHIRFIVKSHPRYQHTIQHDEPTNALYVQSQAQIDAVRDQLSNQTHTNLIPGRVGNPRSQSSRTNQIIRSPFPRQIFSPAMSGYEASSEIDTDVEGYGAIDDEHERKCQGEPADYANHSNYNGKCAQIPANSQANHGSCTSTGWESRPGSALQTLLSFMGDCVCEPANATCPCWAEQEEEPRDTLIKETRPLLNDGFVPSGYFQSPNITQNHLGYQSLRKPDSNHATVTFKNT